MSMFWIFKLSQTLYDCRYSMNVWEQVITNNQSNKSFIDKKNNPPDTDANGHKLKLQDSNLTAGQPRTAPITLYISFNKHRRLTNEELINLTGIQEANSVLQHHAPDVIHSRSISAFWLSSDSWLLFTPLLHHSISDNELNSLLFLCDLSQPFEKVHPNSSSHQRWMPSVHLSEDPNLFFNNYHWLRLQFLLYRICWNFKFFAKGLSLAAAHCNGFRSRKTTSIHGSCLTDQSDDRFCSPE